MWARLENNVVCEIINFDPAGMFHPSLMWAECGPEVALGWTAADGVFFPPPAPPKSTLEEVRSSKIALIDAETSAAITAGFDFDISGETLHFSYKLDDQQNFADTANGAGFGMMGVPGVPKTVSWNGWREEKDADGKVVSRTLVELVLTAESFLALYMGGALAHKATCMERGRLAKLAVNSAQTVEEIQAVVW